MTRCAALISMIIILVSLSPCYAYGSEEVILELQETEWTWEPQSTAVFEGSASFPGEVPEQVVLKLFFSVQPDDSDPGEVVFQTVNEKKLTLRKQKSEYTLLCGGENTFSFTACWKTPESVFFSKVEIVCRIYNEDESRIIAEKRLVFSRSASEIADIDDGKIRLKADFTMWTIYSVAAAAVIWLLAALRIIINKIAGRKQ